MAVLDNLSGFEFEDVVKDVFRNLGYENVRQADRRADEGRDVLLEEVVDGTRRAIYDQENLEAFREEYADMGLHQKAMENPPVAGGGIFLLLIILVMYVVVFSGAIEVSIVQEHQYYSTFCFIKQIIPLAKYLISVII